ncbi:MAG TPA: TonB family protein [Candidatus Eremiobacteraceae bacterium]|nr:TonB family protein [Candidatus Eremiobacteraceae bacterium]
MSTPANPQHLLRRPKKPQAKTFSWRIPIIAGVVVVITGGGIAGFTAFGHGRTSSAPPAPAATTQAASLALTQNYVPPVVGPAPTKHKTHKSTTPEASPSPNATQTPDTAPTPVTEPATSIAHTESVSSAAAKHQSNAARLAAAHRAALALASSGLSSLPQSSAASTTQNSNPAPEPVSTQPPTQSPATPDAEPTPVYAPTIVVDARFVDRAEPVYPDIAKEQGVGGTAIVLATIGPDGRVISVSIDQSTGNRQLDNAAVAAAHSSRFEPPEIDGKPATETYRIVYTFDPNG